VTFCKSEISVKSFAIIKPDLEMDKGELIQLNSQNCGSVQNTHVNDVEVKISQGDIVGGILLLVMVTLVLILFLGAIGTILVIIPIYILQQQRNLVNAFNLYKRPRL
jgi:hypothetical protein